MKSQLLYDEFLKFFLVFHRQNFTVKATVTFTDSVYRQETYQRAEVNRCVLAGTAESHLVIQLLFLSVEMRNSSGLCYALNQDDEVG